MNKVEAKEYLKAMREIGFMTHSMILEIYNDKEEIPQEALDLMCYKKDPCPHIIMYMSEEGMKRWNNLLKQGNNEST